MKYALIYKYSLTKIILLILAITSPLSAQYKNTYWTEYGNNPVLIQQRNNGSSQTLKFVAFKDGMLVAELAGGIGEVSLPVSESMTKNLRLDNSAMPEIKRMTESQNYIGALSLLRPKAYPLIKFHQVPNSFRQLHQPIQELINILIDAGEYEEAEDVLSRITLDKVDLKYSESAIRLMNAYLLGGKIDAGAKMAKILPVQGTYASNISSIVEAADTLRASGEYQAVIPLYREIEKVVPQASKDNVRMWLAYCLVLADRLDEANPIIDSLKEPASKDRLFSLYKLLQGSREHSNGNYNQALDVLTRGFVRAQTSYDWVPEMLYLIGDCYARATDTVAARNVWTEIAILYPESPWAGRAESSLAELPIPKQSTDQ